MRAPTKKRQSSGLCPAVSPARRRPGLGTTRAHLSAGTAPRSRAARPGARPPRSRASRRRRVGGLGVEGRRAEPLRRARVCPPARQPLGHTPRRPRPRRPLPARPRPRETPPPRGGPPLPAGTGGDPPLLGSARAVRGPARYPGRPLRGALGAELRCRPVGVGGWWRKGAGEEEKSCGVGKAVDSEKVFALLTRPAPCGTAAPAGRGAGGALLRPTAPRSQGAGPP